MAKEPLMGPDKGAPGNGSVGTEPQSTKPEPKPHPDADKDGRVIVGNYCGGTSGIIPRLRGI